MEDNLDNKLEELIEEKVKQRVEERVQEELEKREIGESRETTEDKQSEKGVSRRNFLKKLGAGAIGLGALSLSPASALNMRSNDFTFYGADNTEEFQINDGGPVEVRNADLDIDQDLSTIGGTTIWDSGNSWVPTSVLESNSVTVAGNSVSLGSSTSVSHSDLNNISSNDHHSKYTDSEAVSAVESQSSISVDISGDADTVDDKHADEIASSAKGIFVYDEALKSGGNTGSNTSIPNALDYYSDTIGFVGNTRASNGPWDSPPTNSSSGGVKQGILWSPRAKCSSEAVFRALIGDGDGTNSDVTFDTVQIIDTSDDSVIAEKTSSGSSFDINVWVEFTNLNLSESKNYAVVGTDSSSYTWPYWDYQVTFGSGRTINMKKSYTYSSGSSSTTTSQNYVFKHIELDPKTKQAKAETSFPSPSSNQSWDLATFQTQLDNESIQIDIIDGSNNVLHSDISRDFDISGISTSKNVQLRATLSRTDTSNDPRVKYLARQYQR